jgi:malate dehydrogenase (oxaloacetate-decarboxylating)(NADP+)
MRRVAGIATRAIADDEKTVCSGGANVMSDSDPRVSDKEALLFHSSGRPGKLEIAPTKPLTTQRDLSLAYSPGVAAPCLEIKRDPSTAYVYTAVGNIVAVISNGTAVLGLGNLGPLAAKPVMEGKAVLFKRFADIDGINIEVDTEDVDEFVNCVRFLGKSFGGINLEDIKAPECFVIEQRLKDLLDIPVFHDDQHGTAIICSAAMLNALDITGRDIADTKLVVNGAGAAANACLSLIKSLGLRPENAIMCDSRGVIYKGREAGMNEWKLNHAADTKARTLAEAIEGADMLLGCSVKDAFTPEMVASMGDKPIIFAMANPDPEIKPEVARKARADVIVATGRSDYPNQVNNVLCFPFLFRGALDVQATTINEEMKMAAAYAIAELARGDVPDEVAAAYGGVLPRYGPEYIIPAPFDPRLIVTVPAAVAKAAMDSGVARRPLASLDDYRVRLRARLDPTADNLQAIFERVRANPRRVVFAEGEEEKVIRAAVIFRDEGYGTPVLIGREELIDEKIETLGLHGAEGLERFNARLSDKNKAYVDFLYARLNRRGHLRRDCQRMVNQDRNTFAACMVARGDADAMVTGVTRNWMVAFESVSRVLEPKPGNLVFALTLMVTRGQTLFIADSNVEEQPSAERMADMAVATVAKARQLGHEPRVAMLSFSNFGNPWRQTAQTMRDAVAILDSRDVDFEYDGEMTADMALDPDLRDRFYPFSRLTGPANVLIMPGLHSAHISSRMLQNLGGGTVIGPLLMGLSKPAQIVQLRATVSDLVNAAALAAYDAID